MNPSEDLSKKFKRHTAYKLWIGALLQADVVEDEQGRVFSFEHLKFLRVNVLGIVVHVFLNERKDYGFVVLDDGSGQASCKFWNEDARWITKVNVGDAVLAVGRLFISGQELVVSGEFLRTVDVEWLFLRKKELLHAFGAVEKTTKKALPLVEVVKEPQSLRLKVLDVLESAPAEGIEAGKVVSAVGKGDVQKVIQELLMEGEIYAPRVGFLKLLT